MGDKAFVTPAVLKWARETARMTMDQAAAKAGVAVQKVVDWEEGVDKPTIRQAELLADAYKRPFAIFMLPAPPRDFTLLRDFRKKNAHPLTTASIFIIREMQEKQAWTREWLEEEGREPLSFVGRFSIKDKPSRVAADILKELNIHPPSYTKPIRDWIAKAEEKGIFISRTSFIHSRLTLDSEEFQGFVIADPLAPFIFINTEDWDTAQLFTLVHEIAHLWIKESGISNAIHPESIRDNSLDPIERFCNMVAAAALMPKGYVESLSPATFHTMTDVYKQASRCGVSSIALLIRAYELNLIPDSKFRILKREADQAFTAFEAREAGKKAIPKKPEAGGPDALRLRTYRNGLLFSRLVLDAFRGGLIQPTEASSLLGTAITKFTKLEAYVYP